MKKIFTKDQILTIPNLLSLFRLVLIPFIVIFYVVKKWYYVAVGTIILSGVTDVVDGFVARKFNMTSDFGKIFDPIADKLTQGVIILCLSFKYQLMRYFVGIFVIKEIIMFVMGAIVYKKDDSFNSARWYGKVNTVLIYLTIAILILLPDISLSVANALIIACICTCISSLVLYAFFYASILRRRKKINEELALTKTQEKE